MSHHFHAVTRAIDLLRAAGIRTVVMPRVRIDADQHEAIRAELCGRSSNDEDDTLVTTGHHEDYGRVTLRRTANVFMLEAEDISLVRLHGAWSRMISDA